jgi:transketolase
VTVPSDGEPWTRLRAALQGLGEKLPKLVVISSGIDPAGLAASFGERFPGRAHVFPDGASALRSLEGTPGSSETERIILGSPESFAGSGYDALRSAVSARGRWMAALAVVEPPVRGKGPAPAYLEDLGRLMGLPGLNLLVPSDLASAARAVEQLFDGVPGPVYLRAVAGLDGPPAGGTVEFGKAAELHPGTDVTLAGVGRPVSRCLAVARELEGVGVAARVLDLASVKPLDERAILRAARETGAILVVEEHMVHGGVGSLVAALTAENEPVPVRRLGVPDSWAGEAGGDWLDRWGFSVERIRDEAWELLARKGKVQ